MIKQYLTNQKGYNLGTIYFQGQMFLCKQYFGNEKG